jgi:hypothetical protein
LSSNAKNSVPVAAFRVIARYRNASCPVGCTNALYRSRMSSAVVTLGSEGQGPGARIEFLGTLGESVVRRLAARSRRVRSRASIRRVDDHVVALQLLPVDVTVAGDLVAVPTLEVAAGQRLRGWAQNEAKRRRCAEAKHRDGEQRHEDHPVSTSGDAPDTGVDPPGMTPTRFVCGTVDHGSLRAGLFALWAPATRATPNVIGRFRIRTRGLRANKSTPLKQCQAVHRTRRAGARGRPQAGREIDAGCGRHRRVCRPGQGQMAGSPPRPAWVTGGRCSREICPKIASVVPVCPRCPRLKA